MNKQTKTPLLDMAMSGEINFEGARSFGDAFVSHALKSSGIQEPTESLEQPTPAPSALLAEKEDLEDLLSRGPTDRQRAMLERQLADVKQKISLFESGKRAGRAER